LLARNHKTGPLRSGRRGPMYPDRADLEETKKRIDNTAILPE